MFSVCLGAKQRSINFAATSRDEGRCTKASRDTGAGVVTRFCLLYVDLHFYVSWSVLLMTAFLVILCVICGYVHVILD